jgi:hypothetical protein
MLPPVLIASTSTQLLLSTRLLFFKIQPLPLLLGKAVTILPQFKTPCPQGVGRRLVGTLAIPTGQQFDEGPIVFRSRVAIKDLNWVRS